MNHVIISMVAIAAVTAVASPATAQDAGTGGLRVGVLSGIDIMRPGSTVDSDVPGDDQSTEGLLYGLEVGYDLPLGAVVLGVEGEWSGSNAKTKADRRDPNLFGFGQVSTGRDLYVGGRLGVAATPATLVYLKGGYTNTSLNVTAANGTLQTDEKFRLDGWRLGGGVQQSLGLHSYVKLEYRYSNYDDASFELANGITTNRFGVDTDRHQVVAGVGIRF